MLARQRELRRVVIEYRAQPLGGVVAGLAGLREAGGDVVRRRRFLIVRQVARDAGGRQRRVLAVGMAGRARDRRVLARQWKLRRIVIERRSQPLGGVVAGLAGLREAGRDVVRRRRFLIIRQVARDAGGRQRRVLAVGMALRAGGRRVLAGEREFSRAVIEGRSEPLNGVVAGLAGLRESRGDVVRIGCCGEVLRMAADAGRHGALIVAADVAGRALYGRVSSGELELRELVVVETRKLPVIDVVAGFARGWKTGGAVIHAFGLLKVLLVASDALRAQPRIHAGRGSAMAGIARHRRVTAEQWKAVQVILNRSRGNRPSLNRVAVFALSAELAPVEIGVAVRTLRPGFGKNVRDVARFTGDVLMHPAQWELGSAVVELGLRAQRREAGGGVTVLASDRNRPVRIPRSLRLDRWHEPQSER